MRVHIHAFSSSVAGKVKFRWNRKGDRYILRLRKETGIPGWWWVVRYLRKPDVRWSCWRERQRHWNPRGSYRTLFLVFWSQLERHFLSGACLWQNGYGGEEAVHWEGIICCGNNGKKEIGANSLRLWPTFLSLTGGRTLPFSLPWTFKRLMEIFLPLVALWPHLPKVSLVCIGSHWWKVD